MGITEGQEEIYPVCTAGDRESKPPDPKPLSQRSIQITPVLHCPKLGSGPWVTQMGGTGGAEQGNPEPATLQGWGGEERWTTPTPITLPTICVAGILLGAGGDFKVGSRTTCRE